MAAERERVDKRARETVELFPFPLRQFLVCTSNATRFRTPVKKKEKKKETNLTTFASTRRLLRIHIFGLFFHYLAEGEEWDNKTATKRKEEHKLTPRSPAGLERQGVFVVFCIVQASARGRRFSERVMSDCRGQFEAANSYKTSSINKKKDAPSRLIFWRPSPGLPRETTANTSLPSPRRRARLPPEKTPH